MSNRFHRPIALLARHQPGWRWREDKLAERLETWLRAHPWIEAATDWGIFFFGGLLTGLLIGKWWGL